MAGSTPPWSVVLLVTLPRLSQRLILVVPTAADSVPRISDYAAIFEPTHLLDRTLLSSATSSSIPTDFSSSRYSFLLYSMDLNWAYCATIFSRMMKLKCVTNGEPVPKLGAGTLAYPWNRHCIGLYICVKPAETVRYYRLSLYIGYN